LHSYGLVTFSLLILLTTQLSLTVCNVGYRYRRCRSSVKGIMISLPSVDGSRQDEASSNGMQSQRIEFPSVL